MKRLFLFVAVAALGITGTAQAQEAKFDEAAIIKKVEKLELDSQTPKRGARASSWIDLGNAYLEAGTVAATGLYRGLGQLTAQVLFPKPEEGTENVAGTEYVKWSYPYFDLYLKDGAVYFWKMKKTIVDNALEKAAAAYKKAYELEPKDAEAKVAEGFKKIADAYKQDADNLYVMREFDPMADAFAAAYDVQNQAPLNKIDTVCCFNAGYLYTLTGKFDKGVKYLNDAIANGYESNGEAYYYLYHCYRAQKDFEKAKEALVTGLGKYPKNNQILEQLIVLYSETGEDPNTIIPYIQQGIANDPNNAELWAGLGTIYDKLGNTPEALKAFGKALELAPDEFTNNFNYSLMLIRQADLKTEEFNKKSFTSREERDAAMKEVDQAYVDILAPLEKAHVAKPDDPTTVELLKSVYFRLRDTSPAMMENFKKYDELFKSMPQQ